MRHSVHKILTSVRIDQEPRWERETIQISPQMFGGYLGTFLHAIRLALIWRSSDAVVSGNIRAVAMYGFVKRLHPFWKPKLISLETRFDDPMDGITWKMKLLFQRFAFKSVDVICVSARREIPLYSERLKLSHSRFRFVPWHTNVIEPSCELDDGDYIFAAGRTGRDWLTLAEVTKRTSATFVIVMSAKDLRAASFPENVKIRTDIAYSEYRELLRNARIVVVPLEVHSYSSGQVALLEAMALGKPVICTQALGTEDYVEHGKTGLLVPPSDVDAMLAAIAHLENRQVAQRLGENALRKVLLDHTFSRYVDRIIRVARDNSSSSDLLKI